MSAPLRVGVIGTGAMGRHHLRVLSQLEEAELVGLVDLRSAVAEEMAAAHGTTDFVQLDELLEAVDAVVVAVPTADHHQVVLNAFAAGCHVLVEKPMARDLIESQSMIDAAGGRVLAVGHVEFYNPAVQRLLELSQRPRFIEVERISEFTPRSLDVDVILDLMIHDVQIVQALDPSGIAEIRAIGVDVLTQSADIASARLELRSGCVVNLTASRISDQVVRCLRLFDLDSYYSLDYRDQSIKGFRLAEQGAIAGAGGERQIVPADVEIEKAEPLRRQLEAFVRACRGEETSLVDGARGHCALETALAVARTVAEKRGGAEKRGAR